MNHQTKFTIGLLKFNIGLLKFTIGLFKTGLISMQSNFNSLSTFDLLGKCQFCAFNESTDNLHVY